MVNARDSLNNLCGSPSDSNCMALMPPGFGDLGINFSCFNIDVQGVYVLPKNFEPRDPVDQPVRGKSKFCWRFIKLDQLLGRPRLGRNIFIRWTTYSSRSTI